MRRSSLTRCSSSTSKSRAGPSCSVSHCSSDLTTSVSGPGNNSLNIEITARQPTQADAHLVDALGVALAHSSLVGCSMVKTRQNDGLERGRRRYLRIEVDRAAANGLRSLTGAERVTALGLGPRRIGNGSRLG